ncbi:MAG TPA: NUDIX hydrolase [Acetobacteraceae bacterium]|jgi:8-oxo-dGTP pyrophosphatase MutT (NUDIX family)|nr:NUDIX hydrolase [Acetobacteraceae bacterium]
MTDHAAQVSSPPVAPVAVARPAASLLVLRGAGRTHEPEVLMGVRGAAHKFMPNRLVFPGGRVDDEDLTAACASALRADVLARLMRGADQTLAQAIAVAAARELEEETGLTLGAPPEVAGFDYLCRAITPERSPIRFDARFLVVDAEMVTGTLAGSGELEGLRWYGLGQALALDLAFPTRGVLERLTLWLALSEAERQHQANVATLRNRGWVME